MASRNVVPLRPKEEDYDLHKRLDKQIHLILKELEDQPEMYGLADRLKVVTTLGMWLTRDIKIRQSEDESKPSGSSVRKYQSAFRTNMVGRSSTPRDTTVADSDVAGLE
jgi:hypothetical protein